MTIFLLPSKEYSPEVRQKYLLEWHGTMVRWMSQPSLVYSRPKGGDLEFSRVTSQINIRIPINHGSHLPQSPNRVQLPLTQRLYLRVIPFLAQVGSPPVLQAIHADIDETPHCSGEVSWNTLGSRSKDRCFKSSSSYLRLKSVRYSRLERLFTHLLRLHSSSNLALKRRMEKCQFQSQS